MIKEDLCSNLATLDRSNTLRTIASLGYTYSVKVCKDPWWQWLILSSNLQVLEKDEQGKYGWLASECPHRYSEHVLAFSLKHCCVYMQPDRVSHMTLNIHKKCLQSSFLFPLMHHSVHSWQCIFAINRLFMSEKQLQARMIVYHFLYSCSSYIQV